MARTKPRLLITALTALTLTIVSAPFAQPAAATPTGYSPDLTFANTVGTSIWTIYAMTVQKDDKILIYGQFNDNNVYNTGLRRFSKTGVPDATFNANAAGVITTGDQFTKVAVAPGGKIVVAGGILNSQSNPLFVKRLNADGTLDTAFSYTPANTMQGMGVQPDGKVLISGSFGGSPAASVLRLNTDGTLDTAFNSAVTGSTPSLGMPSDFAFDGTATNFSIIMGGSAGLFKLDQAGTRIFSLNAATATSVTSVSVSRLDGSILVGGLASGYAMKRFTSNGTLDFSVSPRLAAGSARVLALPDGTSVFLDGTVRLFDTTGTELTPSPMTTSGNDLDFGARQTDGSLLIGGRFTQLANAHGKSLARLTNPSAADPDTTAPVVSGGNTTPTVTAGSTAVATFTADEAVTWSVGGVNAALFDIVGGALTFKTPATSGTYTVTVIATDAANNVTTTTITVTVSGGGSNSGGSNGGTSGDSSPFGVNPSFVDNLGSSFGSSSVVEALAVDSAKGDILAGGTFGKRYLKRFSAKGVPNTSFDKAVADKLNGTVNAIVVEPDGDVVVGGRFSGYLKRFSRKGVQDKKFKPSLDGAVEDLALQSDGDIVAAGDFTGHLKRFNADGTADTAFNNAIGLPGDANAVDIDANGDIVVGGDFGVKRFDSNGTADATFNNAVNGQLTSDVTAIEVQSDGSVIVGGDFGVKKFNGSGAADASFNANASSLTDVLALADRADQSVLVGGSFSGRLATLGTTGTPSVAGVVLSGGAVRALATQSDGSVLAGGSITGRLSQLAVGTRHTAKASVYFKASVIKLNKAAKAKIKKIYKKAKAGTIITVKVTGYDKSKKNKKYALKRAAAVTKYLKSLGFKTKVATATAKGGKGYKGRKAAVKITYITNS